MATRKKTPTKKPPARGETKPKPPRKGYRPPPKRDPCADVHYEDHGKHGKQRKKDPHDYDHTKPPDNPRYPDRRIYGTYATKRPPTYVPHPYDHACFKPRCEDYRPPAECEGDPAPAGVCVRRNQRSLTTDQRDRFLNAFNQVNTMGALGPLVDIHSNAIHQMHGNPRFLPWHRIYLLRLEELLQMVDPSVCIPYWRSSQDQAFPGWLSGFLPTVTLTSGPHTVSRNVGLFSSLPDAAAVTAALANGAFGPFAGQLEGIHNSGHVWVGGSMGLVAFAPCDPIFWMHHCEIDRIWAEWQAATPGQHPPLTGTAATMDPWPETEADTRDIAALGYSYV